jgi:hypothetical protein
MKHLLTALALSLGFGLLVPTLASAQELGSKGDAIFSVDRLMGVTGTKRTEEFVPNIASVTSISFGWRRATPAVFDVPRFAFDYLPIEHLSIGGSLGYVSVDSDGDNDYSSFLIAPRVGYLYSFGRVVGIWPRGGFTYHTQSIGNTDTKGFALSLECPFTFSPATHFAFHVGPTFDVDMFGSIVTPPIPKHDLTYRTFGLNAGLLGWF